MLYEWTGSNLDLQDYRVSDAESVLTPALVIYPQIVEENIRNTLRLLDGDTNRWRPHIKTTKLEFIMRELVHHGVTNFKCATTLELQTACRAGALDILVATPMLGANAGRVREIAHQTPGVLISTVVDNPGSIGTWVGSGVGIFIDVNPGMDRTGIAQEEIGAIVSLAKSVQREKLTFRGLHYYDGHLGGIPLAERTRIAHAGYDQLIEIVSALNGEGIAVPEVITAGTPTLPCTIAYRGFADARFTHRASPGTVVYGDVATFCQLPSDSGYSPAALVLSRVISNPTTNRITCDAGHKALAIDCGVPNCAVLGHPGLKPQAPSEEHLPLEVLPGSPRPNTGDFLYLVPRHVCPTVNNFDEALIVSEGTTMRMERVTARGREAALRVTSARPEEVATRGSMMARAMPSSATSF